MERRTCDWILTLSQRAWAPVRALLLCGFLIAVLSTPTAASPAEPAPVQPYAQAALFPLYDALAVGVPDEDIGTLTDAGGVNVIPGSASGLTATGNQGWDQNRPGVQDTADPYNLFGYSLAGGDFNSDGYPDLAIGIPHEDSGGTASAGAVQVLYGTDQGLTSTGNQLWYQGNNGLGGIAEASDYFGRSLAVGDFNGDGYDDLAVGIPYEDIGTTTDAGAVQVLYGSTQGLTGAGDQIWHQGLDDITGAAEESDRFGYALTTGDFNGDGYDDLAVGVPYEDVGSTASAGTVQVLYGSSGGLTSAGNQMWYQGNSGLGDSVETGDRFGDALTAGDFNGDGFDDLAIGVSWENIGAIANAGAVQVLYGSTQGLTGAGDQMWHQGLDDITGTAEESDRFGYALTAGDFNGDGFDDLAVGVPGEDVGSTTSAGTVQVLYGSSGGLTSAGNQMWYQGNSGLGDSVETGDRFGDALTAGDFDSDGYDDLAISIPYEDIETTTDAGAVQVLYGSGQGLTADRDQMWHQGLSDIDGMLEEGDRFGWTLTVLPGRGHRIYLPLVQRG